ncbi:hypothetical protein [Streptomyces sp. NPDC059010]|uniref:hypothetical protein n=1 Tax=Streptomyces sp. NPDC059010 TaxID=3346695 RepID=UPI0036B9BB7D
MDPAVVGVIGALGGAVVGVVSQPWVASINRKWQREDSHRLAKQNAYSEYLRSISASYGQARDRQRSRSEDGRLHAVTAEIQILADKRVSESARDLVERVIKAHKAIAEGASDQAAGVPDLDCDRGKLIEQFRDDLGLKKLPRGPRFPSRRRNSRAG